jgi:hypothetical protein
VARGASSVVLTAVVGSALLPSVDEDELSEKAAWFYFDLRVPQAPTEFDAIISRLNLKFAYVSSFTI